MVKDPELSDPLEILCDSAWFGRDSREYLKGQIRLTFNQRAVTLPGRRERVTKEPKSKESAQPRMQHAAQ
jgi:hypothetical protein